MLPIYQAVTTRFLREDERLVLSEEKEMPLVIEAKDDTSLTFLTTFLSMNSAKIKNDIAKYGAVLLRGFDVTSDQEFEKAILSIQGFRGISDAFMSEEGRVHVNDLKYVLHTNAVYKSGGTLYLGGFHSENYYITDVPGYICFFCLKPSDMGGETGIINTQNIYPHLNKNLQKKLEKNAFFVSKWLVSEVAQRYQISSEIIEKICKHFDLPLIGEGDDKFILMYKPNVFEHPLNRKKALQINFFEVIGLNEELRKCFMQDYAGKTWFWHRLVWKLPSYIFKAIEKIYIMFASFFYSPKDSLQILQNKLHTYSAKNKLASFNQVKVGTCFEPEDIKQLAQLMRNYYSSCLWKKGDILLVDNLQVVHAGMPGSGPRLIRALIGNPIDVMYSDRQSGYLEPNERACETVGHYMTTGEIPVVEEPTLKYSEDSSQPA